MYWRERIIMIDNNKVACFVKNVNIIYNIKRSWSELVSAWRSTVLKGKAQYGWPPHQGSLFCKKSINTNQVYKEVNCTEPSPSVRLPCADHSDKWGSQLMCLVNTGNTNWRERLSTVDLLIKVACFVKNPNLFSI